ncbi:hypothetical protein [Streptomyces sp. NPDC007172]|uniref:hypothetical protein n=1 Tax=Streptomyces sp. NPDC007172 TaxID=3364776 RepID=UPI0036B11EE9
MLFASFLAGIAGFGLSGVLKPPWTVFVVPVPLQSALWFFIGQKAVRLPVSRRGA